MVDCTILFLPFHISVNFQGLRTYTTLKTVFEQVSKHLEVREQYSAARRIFNSFLGV